VFPLAGGKPTLLAPLPVLPDDAARMARLGTVRRPRWRSCHWFMGVDRASRQVVLLCGQEESLDHLVGVALASGALAWIQPLTDSTADIRVDLQQGLVALPSSTNGPELFSLAGESRGRWRDCTPESGEDEASSAEHRYLAIRPTDGRVAVAIRGIGLWLWDWRNGKAEQLAKDGGVAAWSPDGRSLYFQPTCDELWLLPEHREPELVVRLVGHDEGFLRESGHGWSGAPVSSVDGKYIYSRLTSATHEGACHVSVVLEPATGHLQVAPGLYTYALTGI